LLWIENNIGYSAVVVYDILGIFFTGTIPC
jgi:hypothetical protein